MAIRFKVRPRRDAIKIPCLPELQDFLASMATSQDFSASSAGSLTAQKAKALHQCMASRPRTGKAPKSSINYLLSKVK